MPSNTAASMFGGAGGRGSRASVSTLAGLRSVLRSDPGRNAAPVVPAARDVVDQAPAPAEPAAPADDKHTMQGLNERLSGYLGRAGQLEKENEQLQKEIDDLLAQRKPAKGRDWNEIEKPLDDLKKQVNDIAKDNGRLLLKIENTKLANTDFKEKLDNEMNAKKELENDLADLKDTIEETKLDHAQKKNQIDLLKQELAILENDHKDEVGNLLEKIKLSEITVEIESSCTDLSEIVNKIRIKYEKVSEKNIKETSDWYQSKFKNLEVVVDQNDEELNSAKSQLKELLTQKRSLEIKIHGIQNKIINLEDALERVKVEYNQRLGPINQVIRRLEAELTDARAQLERHTKNNHRLLCVTMELEDEIKKYNELMMLDFTAEPERTPNA